MLLLPLYIRTLRTMPPVPPPPPHSLPLYDADANLAHPSLKPDTKRIVMDAHRFANVRAMFVPASNLRDALEIDELIRTLRNDEDVAKCGVRFQSSVGIHPFHAAIANEPGIEADVVEITRQLREAVKLANPKIIGEVRFRSLSRDVSKLTSVKCGLDASSFAHFPPLERQIPVLLAHFAVAHEFRLPLFLHVRDAHDLFYDLFTQSDFYLKSDAPFLIHCFTGNTHELRRYATAFPKSRTYFSLSGAGLCASKPGGAEPPARRALREIADEIGRDELLSRLMIETDAPYQGFPGCRVETGDRPDTKRTFPNSPASLLHVARALSEVLQVEIDEVARVTWENACNFFE